MNKLVQRFLEECFASNELNRLPGTYGGGSIFDMPLIGVSRGDDPIFEKFKEVVALEHLTPAEMWTAGNLKTGSEFPDDLRILSIVFPYVSKIREESKTARKIPADIYSVGRNYANPFMKDVQLETVRFLQNQGFQALAPSLSRAFRIIVTTDPIRIYSVWSERHIAFAAGLGTFSLHEGLITEVGCNIRLTSVITDAPLDVTPRQNDDPYGNCLYFTHENCKECVDRCPGDALGDDGHDKVKCRTYLKTIEKVMVKRLGSVLKPTERMINGEKEISYAVGCAFCQFGVPCMDKNPVAD